MVKPEKKIYFYATLVKNLIVLLLIVIVPICLIFGLGNMENLFRIPRLNILLGLAALLTTSLAAFFSRLAFDSGEEQSVIEKVKIEVQDLQNNLKEESDFFSNLISLNFKYIDIYYFQTQIQANKSFTIAIAMSIMAFLILLSGIILMIMGITSPAYITTAAGLLSEFIGAVFFYLYNKTIVKMGEYHHKLVLTQNISLALKITEQMEGEAKLKAQSELITQLTKDINLHIASSITGK